MVLPDQVTSSTACVVAELVVVIVHVRDKKAETTTAFAVGIFEIQCVGVAIPLDSPGVVLVLRGRGLV
jgi:hypothetical protein